LAGVSLEATVKLGKMSFTAALLFTHRGLSGPAILQISSFWSVREPLTIDFLPGTDVFAHLKVGKKSQPKKEISTVLAQRFRRRLAQRIVAMTERDGCLADTSDRTLGRIAANVNAWRVTPAGTEGYRLAEVTVGGVDTKDVSSKTMEARSVPGLYFIGEVVDVTGHLGGFNFQWAWASPYLRSSGLRVPLTSFRCAGCDTSVTAGTDRAA